MKLFARAPVLVAWVLLAAAVTWPYVRAVVSQPPGRAFCGTFDWIDDVHAYLSYAQQAEDGHILMRNKFGAAAVRAPSPKLVNFEWAFVGVLSRAFGREPHLAFRVMGLLSGLLVLILLEAWLARAGLPEARRLPALLLVAAGGGFGGLLFLFTDLPIARCVDLSTGLSAFVGLLANAHWTAALALTLGALYCFTRFDDGPRAYAYGGLVGTLLAFVRPYDVITVAAARVIAVAVEDPRRVRRFLPLLTLAPALAWQAWVFFGDSAYRMHANPVYAATAASRTDTLLALAPLLAAALPGLPRRRLGEPWRWPLVGWAAFGLAMVLVRPVTFALQYIAGLSVPLLCLAALGLASLRARFWALALLALCTSAPVAVWITLAPDQWFVPRERWLLAQGVRGRCGPGDRLLAPPDIGLYAAAFGACDVYVGHPAEPDYAQRMDSLRAFYAGGTSATERMALLDRECVTHVVLPGIPGPHAEAWLGVDAGFAPLAAVNAGQPLSLYRRELPASCRR